MAVESSDELAPKVNRFRFFPSVCQTSSVTFFFFSLAFVVSSSFYHIGFVLVRSCSRLIFRYNVLRRKITTLIINFLFFVWIGHLNSRQSIVWTLVITCTISAIFQATQAGLEIRLSRTSQTPISVNQSDNSTKSAVIRLYYLYGGNVFALTESAIVLVVSLLFLLLYW